MIRVNLFQKMDKVFIYLVIAAALLLIVGFASANIAGAKKVSSCVGTYLVEIAESESEAIWTISQDGTFQGTDSAEQAVSFSHQQGAWESAGSKRAKATWLDFNFAQNPFFYARVDAALAFGSDCESMTGTLDVWLYEPSEDPLNRTTGGTTIPDISFTGRRINP